MSVLICIPTYESVAAETFKSVYDQQCNEVHGRPLFNFVKGYGCAQARNKAAKEALECGVDYLMFVDSDVILPSNALNCLLEYDSDICVGIYPRRNTSCGQTEVFLNTSYNFYDDNNLNLNSIPSDTRINVKGGGMGCACIKTSLFKSSSIRTLGTLNTMTEQRCPRTTTFAGKLLKLEQRYSATLELDASTGAKCGCPLKI